MSLKQRSMVAALVTLAGGLAVGTAQADPQPPGAPATAVPTTVPTPQTKPPTPAAQPSTVAAQPEKPPAPAGNVLTTENSVTLNGILAAGDFKLLVDITPFRSVRGHVAMKVPCGKKQETPLVILAGVAPAVTPVALQYVGPLSNPGLWCVFHGDLGAGITDIALKNTGTQPVAFRDNAGYSVTVMVEGAESAAAKSAPVARPQPAAPAASPASK